MTEEHVVDGIFHARLTSKRESKSGIFLTIQLTPDDFSPALAQLRAGSLLKMGWQELVDVSVQPLEDSQGGASPLATVPRPQANEAGISKPKKRFEDYSLAQQCGMRCDDAAFQEFLDDRGGMSGGVMDAEAAARYVRAFCLVASRGQIKEGSDAARAWRRLNSEFESWQTDQRHAESIRR